MLYRTLRRVRLRVLLCVVLLVFPIGCERRPDASDALLNAFQGACRSTGTWTELALSQNRALISVIEQLRATSACKPYEPVLINIQTLTAQIEGLLTDESFTSYRMGEERLQELTLALEGATDPALQAALSQQIVQTQVELALSRADQRVAAETADADRFARSTLALASAAQGLLSDSASLGDCLKESPAAAVQLGTNILALGGSFFSPVIGATVAGVGQLINVGVDFVRHHSSGKALWKLHEAKMPLALTCGLEAMTELYCSATDTFALLELQGQGRDEEDSALHPLWESIDIVDRSLPVFVNWLRRIRNGVLPNDPSEAARQNQVWKKLESLDHTYREVVGRINLQLQFYRSARENGDSEDSLRRIRLQTVKNLVNYIVMGGMSPHSPDFGMSIMMESNPFIEFTTQIHKYACWLTFGYSETLSEQLCPRNEGMESISLEAYIERYLLAHVEMERLSANWESTYEPVKSNVETEFFATITVDVHTVLAAAYEASADSHSPREALGRIHAFLERLLADETASPRNPRMPALLRVTLQQTGRAVEILDAPSRGGQLDEEADEAQRMVTELFNLFELRTGTQFFRQRVSEIVRFDIDRRISEGDVPEDIRDILIAAGGDLRARLSAAGVRNLDELVKDINNARSLTEANIAAYRDFFDTSIKRAVKDLRKAAERSGEADTGVDRPNGQLLAHLCTLVLSSGTEWLDKVPWEICSKAVLHSIYPDPDGTLTLRVGELGRELEGKPLRDRICTYHKFMRAGRLAEVMRDRGSSRRGRQGRQDPGGTLTSMPLYPDWIESRPWQGEWTWDLMGLSERPRR